ncbi:MAG: transporter substrate-binding domain-containing protein, partial [Thermodesulfobacteriota bacterium]
PLREIKNSDKRIKIGAKVGTSYVIYAKEMFKNADIVEYPDWDKAVEAAYKGEVLAVLRDEIGVKNFIYQRPHLAVNLQIMVLTKEDPDPIGIAVPSDSTHLLEWVNVFLRRKFPRPKVDEIFDKYAEYYQEAK